MSIVKQNLWEEGDVPQAAGLNAPYDAVATASASVDATNTRDNWITIQHFATGNPCNALFDKVYDGTSQFSTTSTSYVTIDSAGGDPTICALGYQPNQYEILRLEASGLVTNIDVAKTYDNTQPVGTRGNSNYYAFRLLLTYDDGAGPVTTSLGEWGYSFTSSGGDGRYYTTNDGTPEETGVPIAYQTFQFSTLVRYVGAPATRTYTSVALQCKVNDAANTLKVSRNNIIAIRGRH